MADEQPIKAPRCAGCGAWHPFVNPCPYVRSHSIRYEPGKGGVRIEIVETVYFAARMSLAKQSLQSEDDVRAALEEATAAAEPD